MAEHGGSDRRGMDGGKDLRIYRCRRGSLREENIG